MEKYDYIFIQNVPAFYKINLFNVLSEHCKVYVIFLGTTDQAVLNQNESNIHFDYVFLSNKNIDKKKNAIKNLYMISRILLRLKYKHIVYGGWDNFEMILLMSILPRRKNCVISESSIYESCTKGIKGIIKRFIVNRNAHAFVSGIPHKQLFEKLHYKGSIYITDGVGLPARPIVEKKNILTGTTRYLYIGRLIEKKNIRFLISVFNEISKPLTIVGSSALEKEYRQLAKANIQFLGFIENNLLKSVYQSHHCFILPSNIEQWGLVVEEALYYGLPVIVSDMVGCNIDLVENYDSGIIFDHTSKTSLESAIQKMEANYDFYKTQVEKIDFHQRDKDQVKTYLDVLKQQ